MSKWLAVLGIVWSFLPPTTVFDQPIRTVLPTVAILLALGEIRDAIKPKRD